MMKHIKSSIVSLIVAVVLLSGCSTPKKEEVKAKSSVSSKPFGIYNGKQIFEYTLTNAQGMEVKVINYGGIIRSIKTPDSAGNLGDVVLGFDNIESYSDSVYLKANPFFGALIGRYGNRIAGGQFELDSTVYELAQNNGMNHLHGGTKGFDKVVWYIEEVKVDNGVAIELTYRSVDMEEGYPGTLEVAVIYTLGEDNSLEVDYKAVTDKKTVINLTQHTYFNLAGKGDILSQELMVNADTFLPVDSTLIPTGEVRSVVNTPFDFSKVKAIGKDINADNQQLEFGMGFDHCWVLNQTSEGMVLAARAADPKSGRVLEVYTTEPGIQFYSGNFLDGSLTGKQGIAYKHRTGFCLETQHYPNAPNQPEFPSTVLNSGETYHSRTKFVFSVKK